MSDLAQEFSDRVAEFVESRSAFTAAELRAHLVDRGFRRLSAALMLQWLEHWVANGLYASDDFRRNPDGSYSCVWAEPAAQRTAS